MIFLLDTCDYNLLAYLCLFWSNRNLLQIAFSCSGTVDYSSWQLDFRNTYLLACLRDLKTAIEEEILNPNEPIALHSTLALKFIVSFVSNKQNRSTTANAESFVLDPNDIKNTKIDEDPLIVLLHQLYLSDTLELCTRLSRGYDLILGWADSWHSAWEHNIWSNTCQVLVSYRIPISIFANGLRTSGPTRINVLLP